jgi:hypothetical protein
MLDTTLITAAAAGLGSMLGATASVITTWIGHRTQAVRSSAEWSRREREVLYKEFITEASCLAVDALLHSMERPDPIIKLYGVLSRIRLVSGQDVVREGKRVAAASSRCMDGRTSRQMICLLRWRPIGSTSSTRSRRSATRVAAS